LRITSLQNAQIPNRHFNNCTQPGAVFFID
jgi:hypothetical protein